jgi:hypothetical protein
MDKVILSTLLVIVFLIIMYVHWPQKVSGCTSGCTDVIEEPLIDKPKTTSVRKFSFQRDGESNE